MADELKMHPWERAGLGSAPFRFAGMRENAFQAYPGAPVQPGGSCDFCGNGIRYECWVLSSDGRKFKVGTDCIARIDAEPKLKKQFNAEKARIEREKVGERVRAATAALENCPTLLTDAPHPHNRQGCTMRDYVSWCLAHAGNAGRTKAARAVEAALKAA